MTRQALTRLAVVAGVVAASAVAALLAPQASGAGMVVTYGCTLDVCVVQAFAVSKDTYDFDPKIPAGIKSALIAQYKTKYMKYTCVRTESYYLSWRHQDTDKKREGRSDEAQIAMPDGRTLVVKYLGFRKNTSGLLINFQFQCGSTFSLPDIWNGTHLIQKATDDANPTLIIFSPQLIQLQKI
jgi:hypothetical protein